MSPSLHGRSTTDAHPARIPFESYFQLTRQLLPGVDKICVYDRGGRTLWTSDGMEDADARSLAQRALAACDGPETSLEAAREGDPTLLHAMIVRAADGTPRGALIACTEPSHPLDPAAADRVLAPLLCILGQAFHDALPAGTAQRAAAHPDFGLAPLVGPAARGSAPTRVLQRTLHGLTERTACAFAVFIGSEQRSILIQQGRSGESMESLRTLMNELCTPLIELARAHKAPAGVISDDPPWIRHTRYRFVVCPVRTVEERLAGLLVLFRTRQAMNFNAVDRVSLLHAATQIPTYVLDTLSPTVTQGHSANSAREVTAASEVIEMPLERRIRAALRQDGFELHAQRIEPLRESVLPLRYEVLVRMRAGDTLHLPEEFFATAATHDLAHELDRWVISRLLKFLRTDIEALRANPCEFSVNVGAQSLLRESFPEFIASQLSRSAVPPSALILEFAERDVLQHGEAFERVAPRLHDAGCRIALDNCCQGLDIFAAVRRLPVHCLKIDSRLTRHLVSDARAARTVRELAEVTSDIGMETVAERIEDPQVYALLRDLPIDFAQGFLVARPGPLAEVIGRCRPDDIDPS